MLVEHPGRLFIQRHGKPETRDDVLAYVQFLRDESGLDGTLPVDLERIYRRFGIHPRRTPLPNLQGLLVNPELGLIVINASDPLRRQRFSEGHELLEYLFAALPEGKGWTARQRAGVFPQLVKEQLCNEGAAELLMPRAGFVPRVCDLGVSYAIARHLAAEYNVSVTAALAQMARTAPGLHAIVLWRLKQKPTELRMSGPEDQPALFADLAQEVPPHKLRVEWCLAGTGAPFIPRDKSVPDDSSIGRAYHEAMFVEGDDMLELGAARGRFHCESKPFGVENERQVLSLLHLPGDTCTTGIDAQSSTFSLLPSSPSEEEVSYRVRPELR